MADGESCTAVLQTIKPAGRAWGCGDGRSRTRAGEGRRVRRVACVGRSGPEAREGRGAQGLPPTYGYLRPTPRRTPMLPYNPN